jgi:desulfoferrodoxin-like iron-binding protein
MNDRDSHYLCAVCGTVVLCAAAGKGEVICCDEPMKVTGGPDDVHVATVAPQGVFKCTNCGFRFRGETPPERCPSCKEPCEFVDATDYVPGLSRTGEEFVCEVCGAKVRYVTDGGGRLVCCDQPMQGRFPGHEDKAT